MAIRDYLRLYRTAGSVSVLALCDEASINMLLDAKVTQNLGLIGWKENRCV